MKKKSRPPSSSRTRGGAGEDNRAPINSGRPRKNHSAAAVNLDEDGASKDGPAAGDVPQKHPDSKAKPSGRSEKQQLQCCPLFVQYGRVRARCQMAQLGTWICDIGLCFSQQVDCQRPSVGSATENSLPAVCDTPSRGLRIPSVLPRRIRTP